MILHLLTTLPLIPALCILAQISSDELAGRRAATGTAGDGDGSSTTSSVGAQLIVFLALGVIGHVVTNRLIPSIQYYMLKRGICGKDLGKKGTKNENADV